MQLEIMGSYLNKLFCLSLEDLVMEFCISTETLTIVPVPWRELLLFLFLFLFFPLSNVNLLIKNMKEGRILVSVLTYYNELISSDI